MATRKELLEKFVTHCNTQGYRCSGKTGGCVYYRDSDGARCGIGGMLSVESAKRLSIEYPTRFAHHLPFEYLDEAGLGNDPQFAGALQILHDLDCNWTGNVIDPKKIEEFKKRWGISD